MITIKRKLIMVSLAILFLAGVFFGGILLHRYIVIQREMKAERLIAEAYVRVNYIFGMGLDPRREEAARVSGFYMPLSDAISSHNPFGICTNRYMMLRLYYHRTGVVLAYKTVIHYFSQEFESDNSLRQYNNGKHPEMEAFVNWFFDGHRTLEVVEFWNSIRDLFFDYRLANPGNRIPAGSVGQLSPQMLDALARAVVDPDYVLDLTSLHQQGY